MIFSVGDKVRILVDKPDSARLSAGDEVEVLEVFDPLSMEVSGGWHISATRGDHADLIQKDRSQIDRAKAEQLCKTYEMYRKAHDHATAFELAYGIEVDGLPF